MNTGAGVTDNHDIVTAVRESMAKVVREFANPRTVEATLESITAAATTLIADIDSVDVLLIDEGGGYRSVAPTSALASDMSRLQHRLGYGPCIDAAVGETLVLSHDLSNDQRWSEYTRAAVAAGARSVMSLQLYTHQGRPSCRAALNLFSRSPNAFQPESQAAAVTLATHGALALIAHDREAQFHSALASRDTIGQAKGMLMERFTIDAVRAFELLVKLSQDTNTKIVNIAAQIVAAGPER
ncbi:GAF and ANTAR domain-containing protein [Mycobacterium sp. 236(2023)]|uniref:GAF and ANTAR domain-containing protein n=1 Tax=Mycobacterium sp. 236(2023) TaxID=3038163 RepID=UPI002414E22C|nr:GAF and ANTAR domain-containing protein [Mycobacterium sp. 236(2023)]MDG4664382.1 GAF and ANTAR domain-containing protein [Mycobacterium sp. 236(2023)]